MADALSIAPVIDRPYKLRREYKTEILTSRSGREQRRALRATPRMAVEFATTLNEGNARDFLRQMVTAQGRELILPARPPIHDALTGYLNTDLSTAQRWKQMLDPSIVFDVSPGSYAVESDGSVAATFEDREVWLAEPNIFDPIAINHQIDRELIDGGQGVFAPFFPGDFVPRLWQANYTRLDGDAADEVRAFFTRMLGMCGEFFMPTFDNDLPPFVQANAGTSSLTTAGTDVDTFYSDHPAYACICVAMPDGTFQFNRVNSITLSGSNSVLTLANAWDFAVTTDARVSWMPLWRLATDILEVEWVLDRLAKTSLSMIMQHDNDAEAA